MFSATAPCLSTCVPKYSYPLSQAFKSTYLSIDMCSKVFNAVATKFCKNNSKKGLGLMCLQIFHGKMKSSLCGNWNLFRVI